MKTYKLLSTEENVKINITCANPHQDRTKKLASEQLSSSIDPGPETQVALLG